MSIEPRQTLNLLKRNMSLLSPSSQTLSSFNCEPPAVVTQQLVSTVNIVEIPKIEPIVPQQHLAGGSTTTTENSLCLNKINPKKRWLKCLSMEQHSLSLLDNDVPATTTATNCVTAAGTTVCSSDYLRSASNYELLRCTASPLTEYSDSISTYSCIFNNTRLQSLFQILLDNLAPLKKRRYVFAEKNEPNNAHSLEEYIAAITRRKFKTDDMIVNQLKMLDSELQPAKRMRVE